jgi:excisionase family DNA binding protein
MDPNMEVKYLNKGDIAKALGISGRTVLRLAERGVIPAVRMGPKLIRFPKEEFEAWEKQYRDENRIQPLTSPEEVRKCLANAKSAP